MRYLLVLLLLTGCKVFSMEDRPKILLEIVELRTRYMLRHDEVVRQTAAAVLRCRTITPDSGVTIRRQCGDLAFAQQEWAKYDLIIRDALVYDTTIRSTDIDRVDEAAEKFRAAAKPLSE